MTVQDNRRYLALARLAGYDVNRQTYIMQIPQPYMKIMPPDETPGGITVTLEKFVYKSHKREITICMAYYAPKNYLLVRVLDVKQ